MGNKYPVKEKPFNPWHFIWITVVASELFTAFLNTLQYVLYIKTNLAQLLLAGFIDALFVPLIVAPIIIYFIRKGTELKKFNEQLQKEIAEREHVEAALLESEDKFRSIFEQATDGIMIADAETKKQIEANKAMCIMLGYSHDEIVGLNIDDIHPKEDLPAIRESFKKQLRGEISLVPKVPMLRKDGSVFYADINAAPVTWGGKQCLCGIFRDITDKQKLEDQLLQAQKMESIGTLAGGIAHDFNNILTAIVGYGHIALMKMAKDDPRRVYIEHMLEAGDRAAHLTQRLLLFSRKQISERKPVDLNESIRTVDKFLKRVIGEDVECRTSLFEEALPIFGDAISLSSS